ncbi:MAG TPA: ATP-binding protein [Chitinophagaceae bacterium]|nr:ATP-binding protein [Chitinophagaceae bacterium]
MKVFFLSILFVAGLTATVNAQDQRTDSLKLLLKTAPADSNRVMLLLEVASDYYFSKPDSCLLYSEEAIDLAKELRLNSLEVSALNSAGEALRFLGDYPRALKMQMEALDLNRQMKDKDGEARSLGYIGFIYVEFREYRLGLQYLLPSLAISRQVANQLKIAFDLTNIGNAYDMLKMPDSALYYQRLAYTTYTGLKHGPLKSLILTRYGNAWASMGNTDSALIYYHRSLENAIHVKDGVNKPKIFRKIAGLYEAKGQYDSSLYYARLSYINGQQSTQSLEMLETSELLVKLFRRAKNTDSAFFYQDIAGQMNDRIYGPQKFKQLQLLMLEEQQRQQKILQDQDRFRNKIKYIALLSVLGIFLLLAFILLRNNRHKQKANILLEEQKNKIEHTLEELKTTQKQLIQSEKMASLGELTAGIAHEIQNPLNFVNNFSEVNSELIAEMKEELVKGNMEEAKSIADNIDENEKKIIFHGKRADSIVKGMLQHSRNSSGQKEPTDINALADECMRLSYHGLRAKDKSFNARTETDFDNSIPKINIAPQDIGRVILNLFTNAFYSVIQKKKTAPPPPEGGIPYEPSVSVTTQKLGNTVVIKIKDNGNGVPQKVMDKIFQPFFTTKPVGEGTGLGLSMSYEIITKGHNGELKVNTREGEFAEFIINLPL